MPRTLTLDEQRARARAWVAFVDSHGRQPGNRPDAPQDESALYYWINRHRKADAQGKLAADVRAVLDLIAPEWRHPRDPSNSDPDLHAAHAADYRAFIIEHGRTPGQYGTAPGERQLHSWLSNQRSRLLSGRLDPDVRAAISDAMPGWDAPPNRAADARRVGPAPSFEERLRALREHVEARGAPPSAHEGSDGGLGRWLANQRRVLRRGDLSPERKRALDEVVPGWEGPARRVAIWRLRAAALAAFVAQHGRLPEDTRSDANERSLRHWLDNNRRGELTDEQIAALDAITPTWRTQASSNRWSDRVHEIRAFIEQHGHRPRPQGPTAHERRMGFWLTRQRRARSEGRLAPEFEARSCLRPCLAGNAPNGSLSGPASHVDRSHLRNPKVSASAR